MSFEQEHSFYNEKTTIIKDNVLDRLCDPVSETVVEKSTSQPAVSSILAYGLKNVKIELPRVNIPDEVKVKDEIDRYMKLFQCKEKPAAAMFIQQNMHCSYPNHSEIFAPQCKPELPYGEGLKTSAKILNFSCTKCRNNIRYSPNDLQKHFQLLHHGELPSYPCEMCNFSANDFQSFNQHRRTHRSTLVKCEICNDEHRYTLLDLTKHFTSRHCVNGHFQCARCRFFTLDVGTFVQHIHRHNEIQYKCDKCLHVSFSKEEFQKHIISHAGTFPFTCQYCNYMASRKTYLLKHIIALHRDHLYANDKIDTDNSEKKMETSSGLKLILKRYKTGASRKALWRRKRITSGSCRIEENGPVVVNEKVIEPKSEEISLSANELQLNEDRIFLSGTKSSTALQYNRVEDGLCSGLGLLKKAVHGPTVLMVKNNKISVPANYSAKFMGFKMVDGKQHIVIKLLPTDKMNLLAGNKIDGIKDSSAECLQQTTDGLSLLSGAGPRESNQQMSTHNSVYSLASALPNQYSRKIKQESNNFSWNTSQAVVPPVAVVGKCATRFPLKSDTATLSSGLMSQTGTKDNVSWRNSIPQDYSQVLSSAGTNMLHYDPMKKTFPSEFKVLNGEVNSNSKHNNVCYPTDFSNQTLPFHNYSKIGILDQSKEHMSVKAFPVQSSSIGETTGCFPQYAAGLNLEKRSSILPVYGNANSKNAPVFPASQSKDVTDGHCCTENHDGKRYLNTRVNQVLEHVDDKSTQDNISNCVNSFMPKITSVFSLQSHQASNYLPPEVNQSLQDVLKVKPTVQPQKYIKTDCDQSFSNSSDCKTSIHFKDPTVMCTLAHSPATFKQELNACCSTTNGSIYFKNERRVPMTSLGMQEVRSASRTTGVSTLLKSQTDTIITQQLAKDKLHYTIQGRNAAYPSLSEQKKAVLLQSSPSRFFVPLHLAHQQGLQVISGKPSANISSSNTQATRATPLLLNKGPGMILTIGSGSLGTIANATENNPQVLDNFPSKECAKEAVPASELELKISSSKSVKNSFGISAFSGAVSASVVGVPRKESLNVTNSEDYHDSGLSSVKILTGYQGSKIDSLESRKQEIGQEQPVYALLPNGRQAVFLKCMSPNKSLVQNHNVFHSTACTQNAEPKKSGAMQQKLFLKIKTFSAAENCQPVSNVVSSSQVNNVHSLGSRALEQKKTAFSSSDALIFPGKLMPPKACLSSCKSNDPFTSVESVHSSKYVKTRSQQYPSESAKTLMTNKGSSFGSQISLGTMTNKISKPKRYSKQTNVKVSTVTASQKNRNLKRKANDDIQEPPRKKMLHRKCKEKNQMDISELESLIQAPCRQVSKDTVRILKLLPFNSKQLVKCPRRNQPVVVLNHPDADVPEVVNVMKTVAKFKGHVLKVSLSKRTVDALLEPAYYSNSLYIITDDPYRRKRRMLKPVSPVKERFVLKLTLKKMSKNNYQIVKTTSDNTLKTTFSCWFCGRIFDNQDNWVGHGQRHLMEATRDWNSLG